jgi:ubiquinone/menaquinone biosynthesis C-methylase UbiE
MRMTAFEKFFVNRPSHTRAVVARARELLGRINHQPGWRYLDVGCGVGAAAREIAGAAGKLDVTGIDLDPKQIEAAKAGSARPNLHFSVMDATRLDFLDGQFDIVATSMATHHIPDWERALAEMVRVLRTGGYLIYSDHMFAPWLARIMRLFRVMGFPSAAALESIAASAGLAKVYYLQKSGQVDFIWLKNG